MPNCLRPSVMKVALAAALVLLGGGGAVAGAAAASGAAAPRPIDHQLCYTATAKGFKIPANVILKNQFSPKGFKPAIGPVAFHCNPVKKILPSGQVFPITNPNAHLACFSITAPKQPVHKVIVSNQFGKAKLVTGQPRLLCLPSWKSLTRPPASLPAQPPGLSHFTCYPVKLLPGTSYHPPRVKLQDEFAAKPVAAKVSPVPVALCVPTEKIVGTHVFKIINPAAHLLCFPVSQTPAVPKVFDKNQFGTARVTIGHTAALCVPSLKKLIS
jgi:hypothetical protein